MGDGIALVLTAFHEVMEPTLRDRCIVNEKTGVHKRTITDRGRFVSGNIKNTAEIFERIVGNPASVGNWFALNHVGHVIRELLLEAALAKRGRWQWDGLWLHDWEIDVFNKVIMLAYIVGAVD